MATKQYNRDLKAMEAQRRHGMRILIRSVAQADIARELEVSRQTVSTCAKRLEEDSRAWRRRAMGKPGGITAAGKGKLARLLVRGDVVNGLPT